MSTIHSTGAGRRSGRGGRAATLRLAVAGTLAAVALAGCQAGIVEEPTQTPVAQPGQEPVEQTQEPVAQTEEPPEDSRQTQDSEQTEAAGGTADDDVRTAGTIDEGTAAGEIPEPGAEFEVGDTVTTHVQTFGEPGDQYFGYATLATTVTLVKEGDKVLFESADNAADLAGYTPWFVMVEHEWLTYEGEPNNNMIPRLGALNESGGELSPVINSTWSAGVPDCAIEMPAEKGVGEKATNCHVFAVPDGEAVRAVTWTGDDYADGGGIASDNPYWDDPVLWLVP